MSKLMTPGPVPVPPDILKLFSTPLTHHKTQEFKAIFNDCLTMLSELFETELPVMMISGTGSAAMEACLTNTLNTSDEILVVVSGKFGDRWALMAEAYGVKTHRLAVPWGQAVDCEAVKKILTKNTNINAVLCQGVETSTGTEHPIAELAQTIKSINNKTLFMVDGITALGVTPLSFKIPGIDAIVAGSQKAVMLPPGLSFVSFSELAWERNKSANLPQFYFDLAEERKANLNGPTRFSSLVTHVFGLQKVLENYTGVHKINRIKYSRNCATAFAEASQKLGLKLLSEQPAPSLTALCVPENVDGDELKMRIKEDFDIIVSGGQAELKGKIIRIGHMGYITKKDYIKTLEAIGHSLIKLNFSISPDSITKACDHFNNQVKNDYHDYFNC